MDGRGDSELFGPVAPIFTCTSEDQAVADANNTEYGLVSCVYTRDLNRALRVSEALQTGMVGRNQGLVSNPKLPSEASHSQASDAEAATKASKNTSTTNT